MPGEVTNSATTDRSTSKDQTPTQKDIDEVYVNLLDKFDPAARRVCEAGALLAKAVQGVDFAQRTYVDAVQHVVTASNTAKHPQSKLTGQYLKQICEILSTQQQDTESLMKWYTTQLLTPLTQNVKTDGAALSDLQKQFRKNQKAIQKEMHKGKKNGMKVEELTVELGRLQKNAYNHAMSEERKRYGFIMERHAAFMKNLAEIGAQLNQEVTGKLGDWTQLLTMTENDASPDAVQEAFSFLDDQLDEAPNSAEVAGATANQNRSEAGSANGSETRSHRSGSTQTNPESVKEVQPNPADIIYRSSNNTEAMVWHENLPQRADNSENSNVSSRKSTASIMNPSINPVNPVSVNTNTDQYNHSIEDSDEDLDVISPMYAVVQKRPVPPANNANMSGIPPAPPLPPTTGHQITHEPLAQAHEPMTPPAPQAHTSQSSTIYYSAPVVSNQPSNQNRSPPPPPPLPAVPKPKDPPDCHVVAVHPYAPSSDNQISLTPGEKVVVLSMGNRQGWIFGESTMSKQRGWFPENYTRPIKTSLVSPASSNSSSISTDASTSSDGNRGGVSSPDIVRSSYVPHGVPKQANGLPKPNGLPSLNMVHENEVKMRHSAPPPAPVIVPSQKQTVHVVNYDTIPKNNPFSHVRLRPVITDDEQPRKYM